jgi:hypothetical protein
VEWNSKHCYRKTNYSTRACLHAKKVKHHFKKKNLFHELIFFQNDLRFGIFRLTLAEQTANLLQNF